MSIAAKKVTDLADPEADPRLLIMAMINAPLYLFDVDHLSFAWANDAAVAFWGASSAEDMCQRDLQSDMTTTVKLRLEQIRQMCVENNRAVTEHWTVYPNGNPRLTDFSINAFHANDGRTLLLMHVTNSNNEYDDETAYRTTALMHTSTMISAFDTDLNLVYCNTAAKESMASSVSMFKQRLANPAEASDILNALQESDSSDSEIEVNTIHGKRWHALHVQRCTNPNTARVMYLTTETDITEQRAAKAEALRLAFTDSLTGLPNRAALTRHLHELLEDESPAHFAILFLDLDRFKIINDSLGHAVGDQLLIDVAQRLRKALGNDGMVARLGGDEFVMVATQSTDQSELKRVAEQILYAMSSPVMLSGHKLRVLPSIGICVYPTDGDRISGLLEHADAAMYIAKNNQCGYCFYDARMSSSISENVKDRMGLENDLVTAAENDEFELYFQPKISCRTLAVKSVEGLIRWHHPERGLVPPDKFIGIAEETGQIIDLGNWVLKAAMRQQRRWQDEGIAIPVSINISARQFSDNDLLANVSDAIKATGCHPQMIELEITESMLIGEPDGVFNTLHQLSAMGFRLALDDFGTGYSNLAYLQRYPLDCLKIDRLFLADRKRSMLMETILNMGKVLGLEVVAEGVETSAQADWLISHGCDLMQGFYFSKPQPVAEITAYLRQNGAPLISISKAA